MQVTNSIARTISDEAVLLVASIKGGGLRRDFPLLLDSCEGSICNLCYVGFRKVCRVLQPEREKLIEGTGISRKGGKLGAADFIHW